MPLFLCFAPILFSAPLRYTSSLLLNLQSDHKFFIQQNLDQWSLRKSWLELQLMIKQASKEVPRFFSFAYQLPLRGLYHAICHLFKRLKAFCRVLLFKTLFRLYLDFILLFKTLLRHYLGFETVSRVLLSFATARMETDFKKLCPFFSSVNAFNQPTYATDSNIIKENKGRWINHKRTQKKSEPQMGFEPTTLRVLDRML